MKKICVLLFLLCSLIFAAFPQERLLKTEQTLDAQTPSEATITINLLDLPGKNNEKSSWEISCELRIIDQKSFLEAAQAGKLKQLAIDAEKSGELIGKKSFKKQNLSLPENRRIVLKILFDDIIQKKLKASGKSKPVFLFYSTALIFDAKLKKNIVVPLDWIWRSEIYPDARFGMEFNIEENASDQGYSYSRNTFVPEKLPKGFFVTGSPTPKP